MWRMWWYLEWSPASCQRWRRSLRYRNHRQSLSKSSGSNRIIFLHFFKFHQIWLINWIGKNSWLRSTSIWISAIWDISNSVCAIKALPKSWLLRNVWTGICWLWATEQRAIPYRPTSFRRIIWSLSNCLPQWPAKIASSNGYIKITHHFDSIHF